MATEPLADRKSITSDQLAKSHGANTEDVAKVIEFAHANGLAVVEQNPAARTVKLSGTVTARQKAFGMDLKIYEDATGARSYCGRTGEIHLPDELNEVVESVHGLDNRDQAKPHFRMAPPTVQPRLAASRPIAPKSATPHATPGAFLPAQLAAAYNFPSDATGQGPTIALIDLRCVSKPADLKKYFHQVKANPKVSALAVHGATNQPTGNPDGPDGAVVLNMKAAAGE